MTARPIRQKLLSSAAMIGAMALAGLATRSEAAPIPPIDNTRVIQATDTADPGHSYAPGGALDVITINAPTAIINWTPLHPAANPIGFVKQNGEVNGTVKYLGQANGKWLGVPATIGSQIKGPCSRIDLMKKLANNDVQAMYPAGSAPKADNWTTDTFLKAA